MRKIILTVITIGSLLGCSENDNLLEVEKNLSNSKTENLLSQNEINDLLFLREEEKLARDVYLYSYDAYGLQIFKNIASSESSHMNSVLNLLNKYNIDDPALTNRGEFKNTELQAIYNNLTEQSNISLLEALKVGNIIEDLDINDLTLNENRTTNIDLLNVYSVLKCGSRNHLRNFYNQLLLNGGSYVPQFITSDEFESIINSSNEKCSLN